jgi:hypothetical protein
MKRLIGIASALALASALLAEPATQGVFLDQNLQAGYNPIGVESGTKLFYRVPLGKRGGILWESTKVDVGIENSLSPAFDFVGAFVDIEPIAVFDLALHARFAGYYDALGYGFRDLAGYDSDYDSSALDSIDARNAAGCFLSAAPTLKFALGHVAFSDTLHVNYFNVDGGKGYFYEIFANCALAKRGVELFNDAYLLWRLDSKLMLGLNDSILFVPGSGYRSQTLQGVGVLNRSLSDKLSLYAALTAGLYLEDRYLRYKPRAAGMAGILYAF